MKKSESKPVAVPPPPVVAAVGPAEPLAKRLADYVAANPYDKCWQVCSALGCTYRQLTNALRDLDADMKYAVPKEPE